MKKVIMTIISIMIMGVMFSGCAHNSVGALNQEMGQGGQNYRYGKAISDSDTSSLGQSVGASLQRGGAVVVFHNENLLKEHSDINQDIKKRVWR